MKLSSEEKIDLIKQKIISIIRYSTEDRIHLHTNNMDFKLSELNRDYKLGQVLGDWMSLILVSYESMRITFKLHYNLSDIKAIAYRVYGKKTPDELSDKQAMDFMKELCNLAAGQVVKIFGECNIPLGMSLPLCARGFYDIFSDYTHSTRPFIKYGDLCSLESAACNIKITSAIEILDHEALSNILNYEIPVKTTEKSEEEDEEIVFL